MSRFTETSRQSVAAIVSAGAMIAFQIGGKAARDALFLSSFPVTALPSVLIASAILSILSVLMASRAMSVRGPGAVIPYAFCLSAVLLLAEWSVIAVTPRAAAFLFYLHMASFGAVLISGFWSMIGELFDPRTAKGEVGRIAAAGTVGGILGGVIAERTGAMLSASAMLPILAALHLLCGILNFQLRAPKGVLSSPAEKTPSPLSGFSVLSATPYLKHLAALVFLGTVAETLLDYVLKTQAVVAYGRSDQLIRFFGLFYTSVSLLTFVVQAGFSRYSLRHFGLAGTISTTPLLVLAGGAGSLLFPGLYSAAFVRGGQSILRSSLFRSAYELLFAPVSRNEKRAAKTIVDVGFDRLGDAIGGGLIRLVLGLGLAASLNNRLLAGVAVLLGGISLLLTRWLGGGYVATLEKSLLSRAAELDLLDVDERMTRTTMLRTLGTVDLKGFQALRAQPVPSQPAPKREVHVDPVIQRLIDLRAEDPGIVRAALSSDATFDPLTIAPIIRLLGRDDLSADAIRALRTLAPQVVGQLIDALLNADEDFAVRRRVPRVIAVHASPRTVDGLLRGLQDSRFEVRFTCGQALLRVCSMDESLRPQPDSIYEAALNEIRIAERLSEAPRVLDGYEDRTDSPLSDATWKSTDIRLEHIFRLLSLCLPSEPLHVAFQALHTDDDYLKGTALEYLESILPSSLREHLWQFLESPARTADPRPAELILGELMKSQQRIATLTKPDGRKIVTAE